MYCVNCGTQLDENSKFCGNCGDQTSNNLNAQNLNERPTDVSEKTCPQCNKKKNQIYIGLEPTDKFICKTHEVVLGICPNCNAKLRTDKAEQCHVCKASWRDKKPTEITMDYSSNRAVNCPKCHSNQISANRKGIGVKRALLGGVIMGPLGLLAGVTGRKKMEISCLKCGHRWTV